MSSGTALHSEERVRKKLLISADDYQRMGAAGIFTDKPRVELIDGEIYTMSPFTPSHNAHVDKASRFFNFNEALSDKILVRTQGSIRLDDYSEPEPDLTVLRFRQDFYKDRQPTADAIYLVIEVAVNSLETDRTVKLEKYAASAISEYWIVIPEKEMVEVYRKPEDGIYLEKNTYQKTDEWRFRAFDLPMKGSDLLI